MEVVVERTPNPVDIHVGARVRQRRKFQNVSQSDLADAIGLTFQQVQKYERGANRISASKLYETARFLNVPVTYFFEGYGHASDEADSLSVNDSIIQPFLMTHEGIELAAAFPRIKTARHRRTVLNLVLSLAEQDAV